MISEDQAIAIYEAEIFLNISPKDIFLKILLDEKSSCDQKFCNFYNPQT